MLVVMHVIKLLDCTIKSAFGPGTEADPSSG